MLKRFSRNYSYEFIKLLAITIELGMFKGYKIFGGEMLVVVFVKYP